MRFFRIGNFARRMGVSTHLLKHYEDEGLICPEVRPNGYRFYTLTDASTLLECRALRNMGFSVHQMHTLLHEPEPKAFAAALARREQALRQEIARQQIVVEELTRQNNILARMEAGEDEILQSGAAWFLPHVADGAFREDSATYAMLAAWMHWMPVTCSCLRISASALALPLPPQETREFGMIVSDEAASRCGLAVGAPAEYLPPRRIWRRYICAPTGEGGENTARLERAFAAKVQAAGETISGPLYKTVLFYHGTGEKRLQYALLDAPLETSIKR